MANGTKVISATSFVISILKKKGRKTNTSKSCLVSPVLDSSLLPTALKMPSFWKPAMTAIKLNSSSSVFQSM